MGLTIHDVVFDPLRADTLIAARVGTRWKVERKARAMRQEIRKEKGAFFVVKRVTYAHNSMQRNSG